MLMKCWQSPQSSSACFGLISQQGSWCAGMCSVLGAQGAQSSSLASGFLWDLRKAPSLLCASVLLFAQGKGWISSSQAITGCDASQVQMFQE